MSSTLVSDWFGEAFNELHPLLQTLHQNGGKLSGLIDIYIPVGLRSMLGRKLANKLGIPCTGRIHQLTVTISHQQDGLHWDRCFDNQMVMKSLFIPIGRNPNGYWLEKTGLTELCLTVDIHQGGWYWRCTKVKIFGISVPLWLVPQTTAYKTIESGHYRFYVGFSLPLVGTILSYDGLLSPTI